MRRIFIALSLFALPVAAREATVFMTGLFDTEETSSWHDESAAQKLADSRRQSAASEKCRAMQGNFYPIEYASEGDLDCRTRMTPSGTTEAKCHYINVRAYCRKYE